MAEVQRHLEAVQQINKMPRQLGIFYYIWAMIKRKFKINRKEAAKRLDQMNKAELVRMRDYATFMSNAAGYADDGGMQTWWISVENECAELLKSLQ